MVLTAFHVMAAPASATVDAGSSEDITSSVANPLEHSHRCLTISNEAATGPAIAFSGDDLHVAWVNHDDGLQRLFYKVSEDSGKSFTSDEPISKCYSSITNAKMVCAESSDNVAIVFCGKSVVNDEEGIYLIRSDSDGWGTEVFVDRGLSPSIAICGEDCIISYTSSEDGSLDIVGIPLEGNSVVGRGLLSVPIDYGIGMAIVHDGIIHHASFIGGSGMIVYGSLNPEGEIIVQPTIIRVENGVLSSIDLFADGNELTMVMTIDGDIQDRVAMMSTVGGGTYWQESTVLRIDGSLDRIDASTCSEGLFLVFERCVVNGSEILGILIDTNGVVTESILSTEGVDAHSPTLIRAPNGEISSIWVESHGIGSELILFEDVLCDSCNIDRLIEYVSDLDPAIFTMYGRASLIERLNSIQTTIVDGKDASAPIDALIGDLNGNPSNDGCCQYFLPIDSRSSTVKERIESNLKGVKGNPIVQDETVRALSLLLIDDVQASLVSSSEVRVTWTTSLSCRTNRICWGIESVNEHTESESTWYSTDHVMEFHPQSNSLIKFMVGSKDTITGEWVDGPEMTVYTGIVISNTRVSISGTDVSIEWSTDHESTCNFQYEDGYWRSAQVSSDLDGLNHSIALTGLDPNTTYQYRIEASWSGIISTYYSEFRTSLIYIEDLRVVFGNDGSMTFAWETNVNSTSNLLYGVSANLGTNLTGTNGTDHSITVEGLSVDIDYQYMVISTALCNLSETASLEGTVRPNSIYGMEIVIDPDRRYDENRAIISWDTWMDCSDNKVTWGTESETATSGTHHTVTLEDLHDQESFEVMIWSRSDVGSTWMCSNATITLDMSIIDLIVNVTTDSATIIWSTNIVATCTFEYGDDPSLGSQAFIQTSDGYNHQVIVNGLNRNQTYYYSISSTSIYQPRFYTINTNTFITQLMGIQNLSAVSDSIDSITVSWDTEVNSTSTLLYGPSYSALDKSIIGVNGTHHSLTVRNLTTNTEYMFRAISIALGDPSVIETSECSMITNIIYNVQIDIVPSTYPDENEAIVSWYTTVETETGEVEYPGGLRSEHSEIYHEVTIDDLHDHESSQLTIRSTVDGSLVWHTLVVPIVVNVLIYDIGFNGTATTVTIFWETNMGATCTFEYGVNDSLGLYASPQTSDGRHHTVSLESLESGFLYYMRINATSSSFPTRFHSSSNGTFHTVVISISNLIVNTGQAGSILFTWETNRWSDSIVAYGTSPYDLGNIAQGQCGVGHEVLITDLPAGERIYYIVISTASENASWSDMVDGSCNTSDIVMSNVVVLSPSSGNISIEWETSCIGTTEVEYCRVGGPVYYASGNNGTVHSLTLDALSPGEVFQLTLRSLAINNLELSCEWNGSSRVNIISDIQTTIIPKYFIYDARVFVNWSTSVASIDNRVLCDGEYDRVDINEFNHSVSFGELYKNHIYNFLIRSTVDINGTSVTFEDERQVDIRMTITDVNIEPHLNSAVIEWCTSIASVCTLRYDLVDSSVGIEMESSTTDGIHHSVKITNLLVDTEYEFEIHASDTYGYNFDCLLDDMSIRTTEFGLSHFEFVAETSNIQLIWAANNPASVNLELIPKEDGPTTIVEAPVSMMGSICVDGLEWGSQYHFKITAVNHDDSELVDVWEGTTMTSPFQISNVIAMVNGPESVTVDWDTNANASSYMMYAPLGETPVQINCSGNGTHHSLTIDGLLGSMTYQFNITSTAIERPLFSSHSEAYFVTDEYTISNVAVDVLETNPYGTGKAVRVNWMTNFNGTSIVDYVTDRDDFPDYVESIVGDNGTEHTVVLTGLALDRYYFVCRSDPILHPSTQGASTPTDEYNLLEFVINFQITDVDYEVLNASTIQVSWKTNHLSSSTVRVSSFSAPDVYIHDGSNTTDHSVNLTGLSKDVGYSFVCYSEWLGSNTSWYSWGPSSSFTIELPISSITVVDQTRTEATIRWVTNWDSTSLVQYAACSLGNAGMMWTTQQYDNATGANGTSHEVRLTNLQPDTVYTFKVESSWVKDPSLTTLSEFRSLSTSLIMSNVAVSASVDSITVSWTTNMKSNSLVYYGTSSVHSDEQGDESNVTKHTVTITTNISSATEYHVKAVSSMDDTSVESADIEVMTANASISCINVTMNCPHQVTITWNTDVASSTKVDYGTSTYYGMLSEGINGTEHTVVIANLTPGTEYHFRVTSVSINNTSDVARSGDLQFETWGVDDYGSGTDAGNTTDNAIVITLGIGNGTMYSSGDDIDMYQIRLIYGQIVDVDLYVAPGVDIDMSVITPSGLTFCGSANMGDLNEHVQFRSGIEGLWTIVLNRASGFEAGYSLMVRIDGGFDIMSLDVGTESDDDMANKTPGLCIGIDWGSVHDNTWRRAPEESSFFLNLLDDSYQLNIDYLITIRYCASDNTALQANIGGLWYNVATLPGTSTASSYSFVLDSMYLTDALANTAGMNVELRFDHAIEVDTISAVEYSFISDFDQSSQGWMPCVTLCSGWVVDDDVANSTQDATLSVSLPRSDISYIVEFSTLDLIDGVEVMQLTASGYVTLGVLRSYGGAASIQMANDPFDSDDGTIGMDIMLRLSSSLTNVTSIRVAPTSAVTDVGSAINTDSMATLAATILEDEGWSEVSQVDGRAVRSTETDDARFLMNAPVSSVSYIVSIVYQASEEIVVELYDGSDFANRSGDVIDNGDWSTFSFVIEAEDIHDYVIGGDINILFTIASQGAFIDTIAVSIDSDGDGIADIYESSGVSPLDRYSIDTDSDGIDDNDELMNGTDPCDADTDDDGLMDGSETYSRAWSSEGFETIADFSDMPEPTEVSVVIPPLQGNIMSVILMVGIQHDCQDDLWITIGDGETNDVTIWNGDTDGNGSSNLFMNCDLLSKGFSEESFGSQSRWGLWILDTVGNTMDPGTLQYYSIQVTVSTNPLDNDTDHDGILDGEEVNLGADGWVTNPTSPDTDGDDISDLDEMNGTTPCCTITDPTKYDTDDDGFSDGVDRALGDVVVKISITEFTPHDSINLGWLWYNNDPRTFFTISAANHYYSTAWVQTQVGTSTPITDREYYVDVYDSNISLSAEITAWAEDPGDGLTSGDSDVQFDLNYIDGFRSAYMTFYLTGPAGSIEEYEFDGTGDGNDAHITVTFEKVVLQRTNTIVVNGTYEDQQGLYDDGTNLRYTEDDQVFIVYMNCSSASGDLVEGLNTVILPRSVVIQSQLNDVLVGDASPSGTPLEGANFYAHGWSKSSSHVVAAITVNVTGTEGEDLLEMMTENSTSSIATYRMLDSSQLYLLHLPHDVLCGVPLEGIENSPTFRSPSEGQSILSTVLDAATFMYHAIVDVVTFMADLAESIVTFAIEWIGNITSAVSQGIQRAAEAIVNGFTAFVDWIVDAMTFMIHRVVDPIADAFADAIEGYVTGIAVALAVAVDDMGDGTLSRSSLSGIGDAFMGDLFQIVLGAAVMLKVTTVAIAALTGGAAFLMTMAVTTVAAIVVEQLMGESLPTTVMGVEGDPSNGTDDIKAIMQLYGVSTEAPDGDNSIGWSVIGAAVGQFASILSYAVAVDSVISGYKGGCAVMSFVSGILGAVIGGAGGMVDAPPAVEWIMGVTGLGLGLESAVLSLMSFSDVGLNVNTALGVIALSIAGFSIYCSIEAIRCTSGGS